MAGPRAAIWTTALAGDAVRPTMVVSTKLKRGSLSHIRMVVAVKTISCLYEGKRPPSPEASALSASSAVSLPALVACVSESQSVILVVFSIEDDSPSMSSEVAYKLDRYFDLDVVLDIDILSLEGHVVEIHLVTDNGDDLRVKKRNVADDRD